jgi:hypothetical protein
MRILIGAPVRQSKRVFEHYIRSLDSLERGNHDIDYFFILHNSPECKEFLKPHEYVEYESQHEYLKNDTHHWSLNNLSEVTIMKNYIIKKALAGNYDYFMLIDSDLILHKKTLLHLLEQDKDIIGNVFWTKWESHQKEMPNAWYFDHYSFDDLKQIDDMRKKQVIEVGYTGACILIKNDVLKSGVNYSPIHNVSFTMWEDRAFCIRASVMNYRIWLSTHYPSIHLYREGDIKKYESKSHISVLRA